MAKNSSNLLVLPSTKPRNFLGQVKMTGAGSHRKSNKSIRQKQQQSLKKLLDKGKGDFDKSPFFLYLFL